MQKRLNKKAQDLSIGTLILIVLGIVVLVLLILGFSYGWSSLWEKINIFQGGNSLNEMAVACNTAVASNAKITYCDDFKKIKIDGKTEYVNCEDSRLSNSIDTKLTCDGYPALEYCSKIKESDREKTMVNGESCASIVTASIGPPGPQ